VTSLEREQSRKLSSRAGVGNITLIVFALIVGAVAYVGYHVAPFYYYFYDLRNQFEQVIKVANFETDEEIRKKLMYHINKYQIPCEPEDLRIERMDDTMIISMQYTEIFWIPWGDKKYEVRRFEFDATVSGKFK